MGWPWSKHETTGRWEDAVAHVRGLLGATAGLPAPDLGSRNPVCTVQAGGLVVDYLVPTGGRYRPLTYGELQASGLATQQLHELGLGNLAETLARGQLRLQPYVTFCRATLDGIFEASLLLLDNLWETALRRFVPGDYLAAAPRADALVFCRADEPGSREDLLQAVARLWSGASGSAQPAGWVPGQCLFRRTGGRWVREPAGL